MLVKSLGAVYLPFHSLQAACLPFRRCPILIVAPTSVLTNWQREFNTWGAFQVALCHGKQEVRAAMLQGVQNGQFEILITSYDTFRCSNHNQPWLFGLLLCVCDCDPTFLRTGAQCYNVSYESTL